MANGWWDSGWTFTADPNGQTVTLTLTATARYGDPGTRSWSFRLYKNGNPTDTYITGWTEGGEIPAYQYAQFTNKTITYTLSGNDLGTTVTFKVVGTCNGNPFYDGGDSGFPQQPNVSFSVALPKVLWSSGADITVSQTSDMKALVTRVGSAYVDTPYSGTVYYRLWCGGTRKNQDGDTGSSWAVTPNAYDVELTYTLQAYATIWGREFTPSDPLTKAFTVVSGSYIDYFDGVNWVQCKAYYYDGSSWVECKPYYYDGTSWVECSS